MSTCDRRIMDHIKACTLFCAPRLMASLLLWDVIYCCTAGLMIIPACVGLQVKAGAQVSGSCAGGVVNDCIQRLRLPRVMLLASVTAAMHCVNIWRTSIFNTSMPCLCHKTSHDALNFKFTFLWLWTLFNPFIADLVKALHFAVLV